MIAYNLSLQKAVVSYDQTHVVKIGLNYELPVGKGKPLANHVHPVLNAIVGGWKIQYIGNYSSGTPLNFGANSAASGTNVGGNRALLTNGGAGLGIPFDTSNFNAALIQVSNPTNQYLNTQYIKQPAAYTYGTAAPNVAQIRGFWGRSENIALQKNWAVKERVRFQLRAEALNGFNRHTLRRHLHQPEQHHVRRRDFGKWKPHHATRDAHRFLSAASHITPYTAPSRSRLCQALCAALGATPSGVVGTCVRIIATVALSGKNGGAKVSVSRRGGPEVPREEALAQLDRIVDSPQFRSSKRCSQFLRHVVQHAIDNEVDCLKERTLGVAVFDRDPHYDTNQDPIVRTTAGEVRKRLAQYYLGPAHENELRISLPTGAYLPEVHSVPGRPETRSMRSRDQDCERQSTSREPNRQPMVDCRCRRPALWRRWRLAISLLSRKTELDQFWAPLLKAQGPIVMCVGQPQAYNFVGETQRALDDWFASGTGRPTLRPRLPAFPLSVHRAHVGPLYRPRETRRRWRGSPRCSEPTARNSRCAAENRLRWPTCAGNRSS